MFGGKKAAPGAAGGPKKRGKVKAPGSIDEAKAMLTAAEKSDDPTELADVKRVVCRKFPELEACKDQKKKSETVSDNLRRAAGKPTKGDEKG